MAWDKRYGEFVRELLHGLGDIRLRPMFGGAGVYCEDLMFALIFEDVLYLRADELNAPALVAAGARQFTYATKAGEAALGFWSLPEAAADDPDEALRWAGEAVSAAVRRGAAKPKRKR